MMRVEPDRSWGNVWKRYWRGLVIPILLSVLIVPAWAGDKSKDEETLKNASKVLSDLLGGTNVPSDVLAHADCILILPNVMRVGLGIGGSGGRGPMSCRGGKNFTRRWSLPAMYTCPVCGRIPGYRIS